MRSNKDRYGMRSKARQLARKRYPKNYPDLLREFLDMKDDYIVCLHWAADKLEELDGKFHALQQTP